MEIRENRHLLQFFFIKSEKVYHVNFFFNIIFDHDTSNISQKYEIIKKTVYFGEIAAVFPPPCLQNSHRILLKQLL